MIRVILINLFLFLLPFIVYFAYVYLVRRGGKPDEPFSATPLVTLFAIGLMLMMGAIVYFIQFETGQPGQTYVPSEFRDGVLRPGRIE